MCPYPVEGNKQCQLWEEQTTQPDKEERIEHGACRTGMLVALEQEEQGYKKCYRGKVPGINWMQGRTNGYKQEINGRLYGCPHTDDGKSIV